ncbi:MAG: hypothetical protein JW953_20125 [Anaerolineae bacterium]|nr:hypothetical protein [Anaerolineae bacterium]
MKQILSRLSRSLDFSLLLVWLLALPAATPLIQPHTITDSADGLLHLYRVVALEHIVGQGILFARWLPDLAYGYGFPLFVFYAPLSYYLTLLLSWPGLGVVNALNASFILALLVSGTGVYLFTKDYFGAKAGLLAGVAYVYAPMQLLNTLSRGSLPAAWALAMFPFVFWLFGRLLRQRARRPWPVSRLLPFSALTLGLALLMHNVSSLLFAPFLLLYLGVELLSQFSRAQQRPIFLRQTTWPVILAGGLGLALAAFFLLPAMAEKEFAQVERVIISPDFDFRFNFITLKDLFALPQPANTGLLNPHYPLALGLAQVGLAVVGLLGIRRLRLPGQRTVVGWAMVGLVGAIFMMLPLSIGIWERLPLLAFVQHPHRLLGPAAFLLAILAGLSVVALPERFRLGFTLAGVILIFLTALPLLYPRYRDPFPTEPTLLEMIAYEHASGAIGTTSFGEYLPVWVKQTPHESPLEPMYRAGTTIERLDPAYLPRQTQIEIANYGFNQAELVIDLPEPYQVVFHTFYFPGWEALVDGQPGFIAPVSERGLVGVMMPAGRHHLQLLFRETPLRRVANAVSIASLFVMIGLFITGLKYSNFDAQTRPENRQGREFAMLAGLALVLIAGKIIYFDRFDNPLKHSFDGVYVAGADVPKLINFGGQVNLLGYDLDCQTATSGENFHLTAYWQARHPLTTNYSSLAQLVDAERHLYAAQDNLHPGKLLATRWQPWGFVQDPHTVPIPPGTPPGDYFLVIGLYDPATWARLPVQEGGALAWADVMAIPVTVEKSSGPPALAELGLTWPNQTQAFGEAGAPADETSRNLPLRLLGATPERDFILRNDFLRLALFWEATSAPEVDYRIGVRLLAPDGQIALAEIVQPSHNRYPTTRWAAGERVRDNHALWIPPDLPAGTYRLQTQILDETGQAVSEWLELGRLNMAD